MRRYIKPTYRFVTILSQKHCHFGFSAVHTQSYQEGKHQYIKSVRISYCSFFLSSLNSSTYHYPQNQQVDFSSILVIIIVIESPRIQATSQSTADGDIRTGRRERKRAKEENIKAFDACLNKTDEEKKRKTRAIDRPDSLAPTLGGW